MSRDVCVVGAGPAGIAVALRAAKLGHRVVLLEAADSAGGAMRPRRVGDLSLDDGRSDMLLPAALRDLFRKSGRPLERELELIAVTGVRTVMSAHGRRFDVPLLGRGAQHAAVAEQLHDAAADAWTSTLDDVGRRWDAARQLVENDPAPRPRTIGFSRVRQLGFPRDFAHEIAKLRAVSGGDVLVAAAGYPLRRDGHDPDHAPAVLAALPYLEQNLGRWHPAGGAGALVDVMVRRLTLRGVDVRTGCRATGLLVHSGVVRGVRTEHGTQPADVVVAAVGVDAMRQLFDGDLGRLRRRLGKVRPAAERLSTFVRVRREVAPDSYETVLPGRPWIVARPVPPDMWTDPDGNSVWVYLEAQTAPGHGHDSDLVALAAERGLDLSRGVLERHNLPSIPWDNGAAITGWRVFGRLSPITPLTAAHGLLVAGRASYLPAGLPTELLSGALAGAEIEGAAIDRAAASADTTLA